MINHWKVIFRTIHVLMLPAAGTLWCCRDGAQAAVFWDENFDTDTLVASGWDTGSCNWIQSASAPWANGCNPIRSAELPHSGAYSLRADYTLPSVWSGGQYVSGCAVPGPLPNGSCGEYFDRSHPQADEIYTRFWYRTTAFTYDSTSTKNFALRGNNGAPDFWFGHGWGSRELGVSGENIAGGTTDCPNLDTTCNYSPNVSHVSLNDDQWYCIETHVNMGTAGNADGVVEIWVDGVQTLGYYAQSFRGTTVNPFPYNSSTATFNYLRIFAQGGSGLMYYDDFAVGNARIGCSVSQTPLPFAPTGLSVQ